MKTSILTVALMALLFGSTISNVLAAPIKGKKANKTVLKDDEEDSYFPAIRLFSNPDGTSAFIKGKIPVKKHMNVSTFWALNRTEEWEKNAHAAPRRQYVVTLKGALKFKVSNGSTFVLKPGVILLAEDLTGKGHSWEMEKGTKSWERLYIPINEGAEDNFIAD